MGLHSSHGICELTPYNLANFMLGDGGSFETIELAEIAIQEADHFYAFPNPFGHGRQEPIQNPKSNGFKIMICYFVE